MESLETPRGRYTGVMDAREDSQRDVADRSAARRRAAWLPTAVLLALAAAPLATGCGDDRATPSSTAAAHAATPGSAAAGTLSPPKASGGLCERTAADRKSLPSLARMTVERFIAAVDRGDRDTMRALFDPQGAEEALAHLRPVTSLGLRALEDRY